MADTTSTSGDNSPSKVIEFPLTDERKHALILEEKLTSVGKHTANLKRIAEEARQASERYSKADRTLQWVREQLLDSRSEWVNDAKERLMFGDGLSRAQLDKLDDLEIIQLDAQEHRWRADIGEPYPVAPRQVQS